MLPTSIATVSLSGDLKEKLAAISAAGFDGVEIFENDFLAYPAGPAEVGRMVLDAGLEVTAFQPFRDFEGMPEPQRTRAFDRAERKFDVMQALGSDLMLVCSNVSPSAMGGVDRAAEDFHALGERAGRRGLRVGYEALAWGRHVSDHRDAWEIVRRADHPAVGIILDSFHTLARRIDPDSIRRIPADRIFLVQVADAPLLDMDYISWSRHFRNMPGQGALDVTAFLAAVEAAGYAGYLSLEIFNDQFRAGSATQVAVDGRRSLIAAMDLVARSRGAPSAGVRPAGAGTTGGEALPARARPLAFDFIEFAADEESGADLAAMFAALGFARAGRHAVRDVEWWRQGSINLVINSEREGPAHASYITHGPGVCAIGLRVESAEAAMARARALLAQPLWQRVGPGEPELPAIRGLGGSLLYFTDPHRQFAGAEGMGGRMQRRDAALVAIDHISQSMGYDEMLSWLLFYTSILAVERTPQLDIADPAGLVRSQVVESPDGAVRIALNGAENNRTLSGRFLADFFGSGVQHIAFASSDIFASAAAMRAGGLGLLAVPDNYYDDLEARLGLAPDVVDALKQARVLYDRDDQGEYLQLYSEPFADRFFFEIIERRNGYRGYGAANAPIRLAAQARASRHLARPH